MVEWAFWGSVPFFLFGRIPIQTSSVNVILRHMFLSVLPSTVNFQTVIYKKKVFVLFSGNEIVQLSWHWLILNVRK